MTVSSLSVSISPGARLCLVAVLGLVEYALLMVLLEQGAIALNRPMLYHGLRLGLVVAFGFGLLVANDRSTIRALFASTTDTYSWRPWLALQLTLFSLAVAFAMLAGSNELNTAEAGMVAVHLALGASALVLPVIAVPVISWRRLLVEKRIQLVIALVIGLLVFSLSLYSLQLWSHLIDATFFTSRALLGILSEQVTSDPIRYVLGVDGFKVRVLAWCSGIEGMALAAVFTSLFLFIYRRNLHFPKAVLLLPVSMLAMWCMNNLRIVILILIGAHYSPELAIGGFHSNAGWVAFICTEIAVLALAHRFLFVEGETISDEESGINHGVAMLAPGLVFFITILVSMALTDGFPWLYPLRVVTTALVIFGLWNWYSSIVLYRPSLPAIAAGIAVFAGWLMLVPPTPATDLLYTDSLGAAGVLQSSAWLLMRLLGTVIIAPFAEELLFRGYLLATLSRQQPGFNTQTGITLIALVISSILFGAMHGAWLAAGLAGLMYGFIRLRGGSLWDAVAAHGTTNLMLFGYAIISGHWSIL